ncbi:DCL family protein [Saccharopolyspora sp. SCSIO 74807]|uniref:DCL family protein n=1 Tax=Saccharopolyspora sp. SCSIO 74807 TaxID=3118084 RepID=UPI0030D0A02C
MARKPIVIGERFFALKKDAEQECRSILYRYRPGDTVSTPEDERLLLDVLNMHPDRDRKVGHGIDHFEVRENPQIQRKRTIYLVRSDGSETDFSYLKCLTPPSQAKLAKATLRRAVVPQINEFIRETYQRCGALTCAITGEALDRSQAHVDHYNPTFDMLSKAFADSEGGWDAISTKSSDGMIGKEIADPDQAGRWDRYHRDFSSLRIVSVQSNLSLLRQSAR